MAVTAASSTDRIEKALESALHRTQGPGVTGPHRVARYEC